MVVVVRFDVTSFHLFCCYKSVYKNYFIIIFFFFHKIYFNFSMFRNVPGFIDPPFEHVWRSLNT